MPSDDELAVRAGAVVQLVESWLLVAVDAAFRTADEHSYRDLRLVARPNWSQSAIEIELGIVRPQNMAIRQLSLGPGRRLWNVGSCCQGPVYLLWMPFGAFVLVVLRRGTGQGGIAVAVLQGKEMAGRMQVVRHYCAWLEAFSAH
jgi:hypothetical protein